MAPEEFDEWNELFKARMVSQNNKYSDLMEWIKEKNKEGLKGMKDVCKDLRNDEKHIHTANTRNKKAINTETKENNEKGK